MRALSPSSEGLATPLGPRLVTGVTAALQDEAPGAAAWQVGQVGARRHLRQATGAEQRANRVALFVPMFEQ